MKSLVTLTVIIAMGILSWIGLGSSQKIDRIVPPVESIYEIQINKLDGNPLDLKQFEGKKLMIVNVASKCGLTPQYEELQKLHEQYGESLTIIGVPCNQFMNQEPGTKEEIAEFCQKNYGVEFIITEKVDVKGADQHPLYQWLTSKSKNGSTDSSVKWNFQKYLISESGELLSVFAPTVKPMDEEILNSLK